MMHNKRKAILIVLMIAVLLIGAIGGTVAFLAMKTDPVENVFQPAQVPSEVEESFNGSTKEDVVIRNNGNVPAFIRAAIVVTWKDSSGNIYPVAPVKNVDYVMDIGSDWTPSGDYYYYDDKVAAGNTTTDLIKSCHVKDGAAVPTGYALNVVILGQAIQAQGMGVTTAQAAFAAAAN